MTIKPRIPGIDARLFDHTTVSVDGSVEYGQYIRLRFNNGSFWSEASMKPDEAMKLSASLAKMVNEVMRANGQSGKDKNG